MNPTKTGLIALLSLSSILSTNHASEIVLPEFLTNPMSGYTGLPITNRVFTSAYNDDNRPATLGVTITNGANFVINPWSAVIAGGTTPVSSMGGTYNPNGNYTYVGYTTTGTNTNRTRYYVNEQGWSLMTWRSFGGYDVVNIRLPVTLGSGDYTQQQATVGQVQTSIDALIAGEIRPYETLGYLWNYDEGVVDYGYSFDSITPSQYTPSSIFGSPILLLQQAAELSEGLDFIDGRWLPSQ